MADNLKAALLVGVAKTFVGFTEQGGPNKGQFVEWCQRAVDGVAAQEPWCLGFVQRCRLIVDGLGREIGHPEDSALPLTEWTVGLWQRAPENFRLERPEPGCLVIWEHWQNGAPSGKGHVGIVVAVRPNGDVDTVEGNTSAGVGIQREGDGVYFRTRKRDGEGDMRVLGFLNPWP